jgi:hypothetical protein
MTTLDTLERNARSVPASSKAWALAVAAVGAATALFGFSFDAPRIWTDLLVNGFYFAALALSGVLFVAIQYLSQSGWWVAIRRVPEAMMTFLPVAAVLMLAVYLGRGALYPWTHAEVLAHDPVVAAKKAYLNEPFFLLRMVVFLAVWAGFAFLLRRTSLAQDHEEGGREHRAMFRLSAFFLPAFAVTFSLASFDWLMSLDPRWYSTIFAIYQFAGLLVSGIAAITLFVVLLRERGHLAGIVNESHLHDLGKLLFAFSIFWAYIWVSQYLLIWYANIPEEAVYYHVRTNGPWLFWFALVLVLNWIVPFTVLMTRSAKRNPTMLKWIAAVILVGHWLDLYVVAAPSVLHHVRLGLPEIVITAGYAALFFAVTSRALSRAPVVARHDPFLAESLRHHQ